LAAVAEVAGALTTRYQLAGHLPPLVALPPYPQRVSRPLPLLVVLVVKTTVVVVALAERLVNLPHLVLVALVAHEIALVGPQLDTALLAAVAAVTQVPHMTKAALLDLVAQRAQISAERYRWSTEPLSP